jgi:hypothetical protein
MFVEERHREGELDPKKKKVADKWSMRWPRPQFFILQGDSIKNIEYK